MNKKIPKDNDFVVWFVKVREKFKINARGLSQYKIFKLPTIHILLCRIRRKKRIKFIIFTI